MAIILKNVRLSFFDLWVPKSYKNGKPRYTARLLIEKSDEANRKLVTASIVEKMKEAYADKAQGMMKAFQSDKQKFCFRDGDTSLSGTGDPVAPGCFFLNSARREVDGPPGVFDLDGKTSLTERSGKPYSGCYVNAKVDIWIQTDSENSGVRCSLLGVQFAKDGEPFSGSPAARPGDFEAIADDSSFEQMGDLDDEIAF